MTFDLASLGAQTPGTAIVLEEAFGGLTVGVNGFDLRRIGFDSIDALGGLLAARSVFLGAKK